MAFQQWKNNYFMSMHLPLYDTNVPQAFRGEKLNIGFDYEKFNNIINKTLYPEVQINRCGALLLYNLASPEWITVDCNKPIGDQVICVIPLTTFNNYTPIFETNFKMSDRECVKRNHTCFVFHWVQWKDVQENKMYHISYSEVSMFSFLFEAIRVKFPPIFIEEGKWFQTYEQFNHVYSYQKTLVTQSFTEAFSIQKSQMKDIIVGGNLIQCDTKEYISIQFICDGKIDCLDKEPTDELGCQCNSSVSYSNKCKYLPNDKHTCSAFYFMKHDRSCQILTLDHIHPEHHIVKNTTESIKECAIGSFKSFYLEYNFMPFFKNGTRHECFRESYRQLNQLTNNFKCNNGKEIDTNLLNDLVPDCGPDAEDEFLLKNLLTNTKFLCPIGGQLPIQMDT